MKSTVRFRAAAAAGVALAVQLGTTPAAAFNFNGFLRAKGTGDIAPSYSQESYDEFWIGTEPMRPPPLDEIETRTISLWMAYGLTDRFTLFGSLPRVTADGTGSAPFDAKKSDLQDLSLLGAYRLGTWGSQARHQLVGGAGVRVPASPYEADQPVDVGDGTTDVLVRLVYLLQVGRFYLSQQAGLDLRGEDAPDGYPFYTEFGYTFGHVTVSGSFDKLVARDGADIGAAGFSSPGLREEYERAGAKVYVRIMERFGVTVAGFTTLDGRNTGDASGASLGANFSF